MKATDVLAALYARYPALESCREDICGAYDAIRDAFARGSKVLVCGNGGSAADAEHIVGELMKSFRLPRPLPMALRDALLAQGEDGVMLAQGLQGALPALALTGQVALSTAFANDVESSLGFAQQVVGYGQAGDVLICISTSGNAKNTQYAAMAARVAGMTVLGLTGAGGGALAARCDVCIRVPEEETYLVQELHLPVYHALCEMLEIAFFAL